MYEEFLNDRSALAVMSEVTKIIHAIEAGDPHAAAQLLPLVYDELRRLAAQRLAQEKPGQTLEPTALVHEAYLRLVGDRPNRIGTIAATFSPRLRRPCDEFSWTRPAASRRSVMAAEDGACRFRIIRTSRNRPTTCWRSMKP